MEKIRITDYKPEYQEDINQMMSGIEKEFIVPITSPQSTRINEVYILPDQKFWVALYGSRVIGTIGLILYSNHNAVLKRMMVDKEFRGNAFSTSKLLLEKTLDWAREKHVKSIFLGTMEQFTAAQKFYAKQGFTEIKKEELPKDYNSNPIDSLFYKLDLNPAHH